MDLLRVWLVVLLFACCGFVSDLFGCGLGLPTWNLFGLHCWLFVLVSCFVAALWFCLMLGLAAVFVFLLCCVCLCLDVLLVLNVSVGCVVLELLWVFVLFGSGGFDVVGSS